MRLKKITRVKVGNQVLELSNLDKVLYPETGFTKGQMIEYYGRVAEVLLPHLRERPLTMKRYPEGVRGFFFYEKECPSYRPSFIRTATVQREHHPGEKIHYCTIEDTAALIWVANLASIELHILLSRKGNVHRPTSIAFDLDPGPGLTTADCAWAAFELKKELDDAGLQSFPKTSGKKGIHLYVPLNDPSVTFDDTKAFAHGMASALEERFPDRIVSKMGKHLRNNKIFIDWSQNDDHKTTVAVYSLRATESPSVSTPITWDEVRQVLHKKTTTLVFTPDQVLGRIKTKGDLFKPVLTLKQKLPRKGAAKKSAKASSPLLKTYRAKRDFHRTPEPEGGAPSAAGQLKFVIQKHDATHLHYDFRLEADGVLKSWAVPKGPSTQLDEKRLAMRTEDHPIDYVDFEGVIPEGEYGGGTVMVWDRGTYVNLTHKNGKIIPLSQGLAKGHIHIWLKGQKLNGGWSLTRMGQDEKHWLLVKAKDEGVNFPPNPVRDQLESAATGRSLDEIADDKRSRVWHSNRAA